MRLIDTDALIEELNTWAMQCKSIAEISILGAVVSMIENQPTAYDVDKVVEELEEEKEYSCADFEDYVFAYELDSHLDSEYDDYFNKGLGRAIDIVKRGGRDDME